jgi:hypothetical protein
MYSKLLDYHLLRAVDDSLKSFEEFIDITIDYINVSKKSNIRSKSGIQLYFDICKNYFNHLIKIPEFKNSQNSDDFKRVESKFNDVSLFIDSKADDVINEIKFLLKKLRAHKINITDTYKLDYIKRGMSYITDLDELGEVKGPKAKLLSFFNKHYKEIKKVILKKMFMIQVTLTI